MYINDLAVINKLKDRDKFVAESYVNEYQNQASLANKSASEDYKKYMTTTLNRRGHLYYNTDVLDKLYKASFEELFSKQFKNLFLYDLERDISGIYKDIKNVKNMSGIGMYDLFSSMFSCIPAKFFPSFELTDIDIKTINIEDHDIDQSVLTELIQSRPDYEPIPQNDFIYTKVSDDEKELGPFAEMDYYIYDSEADEYSLVENIESFEENTDYYVRETIDPIPVKYTLDDLTEEEKDIIRKQILVASIDNVFICYLKDFLITIKEAFGKYDLYDISSAVDLDADKFDKTMVKILYSKLLNVLAILAYAVSASDVLENPESCITTKLINDHIKNCLSKNKTISDMLTTEPYFNSVLRYYFSDKFRNMLFHRIIIKAPISDSIEVSGSNVPIHKAYMVFTENLIILRNILDHLDLIDTDVSTLFGAFLMSTVMFTQTVYMSAYISKNRTPIVKSVETIMRDFGFSFDSVVKADELLKFVPLG